MSRLALARAENLCPRADRVSISAEHFTLHYTFGKVERHCRRYRRVAMKINILALTAISRTLGRPRHESATRPIARSAIFLD
jgi:hypothetical protein